ncbi:MAG TPA: hypothetical protein VL328_07270 [Gemmatimonadaceae bacterium]|nr:hypothetical protein [Gemmatimonadaceae bacterium]
MGDVPADATPELGKIKLCNSNLSSVTGDFTASRIAIGASSGTVLAATSLAPGACVVLAEDAGGDQVGSDVTITQTSQGFVSATQDRIDAHVDGSPPTFSSGPFSNGATAFVNIYHANTVTFLNHVDVPPVCDFITFGRLVTSVGTDKVVISGNAGGSKPGGGILGEFHIEANGVDNHVADIDTYGPITSGPLSTLTNSRIVTGTAKNGVAVELRLWDGGEPGKGTDIVYVKLDGVVTLASAGQYIDQGNMQYHANCRGPND